MLQNTIYQEVYNKYILPTENNNNNYIGIEIEMPILNWNKEAVKIEDVQQTAAEFCRVFHFEKENTDDNGNMISAIHKETGDILSFDCSYNNLELSLGIAEDLHALKDRFFAYYNWLIADLAKYQNTLTGMGVNPYRQYNNNIPIPNGRYRMLFHHLGSYKRYAHLPKYFHDYPAYGTFASASQVQLDINKNDLVETINTMTLLEPLKGLLFANSLLPEENKDLLCCRDMFWENSTHGINQHNIGMFENRISSVEELNEYIMSCSMYCVERDEKYINFEPIPLLDYFNSPSIVGEYFDLKTSSYKNIEVFPKISDLKYLRSFKFEDLTFRGTIEYRSACTQPIADTMSQAAFHVGLREKLHELTALLEQDHIIYHRGCSASELRKMLIMRKLPSFIDEDALYMLAGQVVNLAAEGLIARGMGEEIYLKPLYTRIEKRSNPAKHMLDEIAAGKTMEDMIREYQITNDAVSI